MNIILFTVMMATLLPGQLQAVTYCYQCQGSGPECADPFAKTSYLEKCPIEGSKFCQKTKTIKEAETIIVRSCALACKKYDQKGDDGSRIINRCCDTDECNAAMGTSFSMVAIVASLLLTMLTFIH